MDYLHNRNIALLGNPRAGKGRSLRVVRYLQQQLTTAGISHATYPDQWPEDLSSCTDVWIVGGDGTLNYFINHYPDVSASLFLFKGGTGNDFATTLYGPLNLQQQYRLALQAEPRWVDAGNCNGRLFLNAVGIGFDGVVLRQMKWVRFIGGLLGYYLVVLRTIFGFREAGFSIEAPGFSRKGRFLLVFFSNSGQTGGGFRISPVSSVNDGFLDLILVQPLRVLQRLYYLPLIQRGRHLQLPVVEHRPGVQFTVVCDRVLPAQLDGEYMESDHFTLTLLPGKFRFRY
ncbi:MAG TPA: diacylglycerol kinase family protein [Lacibacter sp.]|nr:diacylglycerol kinase family protein [Lacibacter sp.]HMO89473.1 diacylglycerol kinase family protein [Lacibacter sp.]